MQVCNFAWQLAHPERAQHRAGAGHRVDVHRTNEISVLTEQAHLSRCLISLAFLWFSFAFPLAFPCLRPPFLFPQFFLRFPSGFRVASPSIFLWPGGPSDVVMHIVLSVRFQSACPLVVVGKSSPRQYCLIYGPLLLVRFIIIDT